MLINKFNSLIRYNLIILITISFLAGLLLANYQPIFIFLIICLFILLLITLIKKNFLLNLTIFIVIIVSSFSFFYTNYFWQKNTPIVIPQKVKIELTIISPFEIKGENKTALAKTNTRHKLLLTLKSNKTPTINEVIMAEGKFNNTPKKYLALQGISGTFYANNYTIIKKISGNPLINLAYYVKNRIIEFNRKTLPYPYSDLLTSLTFGKSNVPLPYDLENDFRKSGLMHVLVVSGAQTALLIAVFIGIFSYFGFSASLNLILITIINIFFYFTSGGGPAVLRAILMAEILLLFKLLKRNVDIYHVFSFVLLTMLLINPLSFFDLGFQLSFIAFFSLIYGTEKLFNLLPQKIPEYFRKILAANLSPYIFIMPITWYYFQQISLSSIISNLLIFNLVELIMPLGFFASVIGIIFYPLGLILNNFNFLILWLILKIVFLVNLLPINQIFLVKPSIIIVLIIYILILCSLTYFTKQIKVKKIKIISKLSLIFIWVFLFFYLLAIPLLAPFPYLKVIFFDVGQGDAILIQTPQKKNILIDTGPKEYSYSQKKFLDQPGIIKSKLIENGINKLDLIILTHFHNDHTGGLTDILKTFRCKYVFDNGNLIKTTEPQNWLIYQNYLHKIKTKKIIRSTAYINHEINLEKNVKLRILLAPINNNFSDNENNNSIICRLSYNKIDFLFMADLEKDQEDELINLNQNEIASEIIKIGHHGSKTATSEELIMAVKPQIAVISVGRNNFGHPSNVILQLIQNYHLKLFRTDRDKDICILTDGKRIFLKNGY